MTASQVIAMVVGQIIGTAAGVTLAFYLYHRRD